VQTQTITSPSTELHGMPRQPAGGRRSEASSADPRPLRFDVGSFHLVRAFVEEMAAKTRSGFDAKCSTAQAVDWQAIESAVADSDSLELAIGRAIVMAHRMCTTGWGFEEDDLAPPERVDPGSEDMVRSETEDPFFTFSVAEAVPDFGESRLRTRVARRVGRAVRRA